MASWALMSGAVTWWREERRRTIRQSERQFVCMHDLFRDLRYRFKRLRRSVDRLNSLPSKSQLPSLAKPERRAAAVKSYNSHIRSTNQGKEQNKGVCVLWTPRQSQVFFFACRDTP